MLGWGIRGARYTDILMNNVSGKKDLRGGADDSENDTFTVPPPVSDGFWVLMGEGSNIGEGVLEGTDPKGDPWCRRELIRRRRHRQARRAVVPRGGHQEAALSLLRLKVSRSHGIQGARMYMAVPFLKGSLSSPDFLCQRLPSN
ncbi:hypothetical protein CB1_000880070 [Camelus ferus]|nr:hypothetical protein CB1_000880070 [Camelus ferus]